MTVQSLRQSTWLRRCAWVVGSILLLWTLAWLAVPTLARAQIEKLGSEQLGRRVTVGEVDFKPWSLELTVRDLGIARAQGDGARSPQFFVKRFYIDVELQSLVRLAPVVDAVEVDGVHVNLTHVGQGRYDVDDILARLSQPKDPAAKPDASPLRFSLYNLALSAGSVDFTDQTVKRTHTVRDLQVKLPFLSNFDSQRAVLVEPHLAFALNGSQFDSHAAGMPFAQTRKTDASFTLKGLDLAPYLGYLPATLPVVLRSAVLDADVKVAFEQSPRMAVKLSGLVQVGKVSIVKNQAGEEPLLAFERLKLSLNDVRPLERVVHLSALELSAPTLQVHRTKTGKINLALQSSHPDATENVADSAPLAGTNADNSSQSGGWKLALDKVQIGAGSIHWQDDTLVQPAQAGLSEVALDASGIVWPFVQPMQFEGSAMVASGKAESAPAKLGFSGQATDLAAKVSLSLTDVPLAVAAPYVAQVITPSLQGRVTAELGLDWQGAGSGAAPGPHLLLSARQLTLNELALAQGKSSLASVAQVQLEQAQVDLDHQRVVLGKLSLSSPRLALGREPDGRWMFENWLKAPRPLQVPASADVAAPANVVTKTPAHATPPWALALGELALEAGALSWMDKSTPKPVVFDLSALSLRVKGFSSVGGKPFSVQLASRIRAGQREPGSVAWHGSSTLAPLGVQGRLDARRVPVHVFEPYLADVLNIELLRADASFKGRLGYAQSATGPVVKLSGDTMVEDFQANTLAPSDGAGAIKVGEELLSWKVLNVRGLDVVLAPGQATQVAVRETVLSDFYARLILSEKGELNLANVLKPAAGEAVAPQPGASAAASAAPSATLLIASDARQTGANSQNDAKGGPAPVINFGPVSLVGGTVHFSDRFIQPNYSANLSELTGKLSAFSSQPQAEGVKLADLELRGRAQGTASLEILGRVNPLAKPLALDIKGRVRDLELSPLSPYSVRYAGYGIERGKLNVEVSYLVLPDGQLTANNNIVLNQLTFGDKVEGAPASLPVKLAVALLADRRGVIDINLPISGSLSDPQFRLGPLVFKLIINLIGRAITSPFSLLASAFGGGADELGVVAFAPGSAALDAAAKPALEKVAKALLERPALRLTVVGSASLEAERDAYKREQLQALVRAEKRRAGVVAGESADVAGGAALKVSADEYPALLKAVYRRVDFPRPRNLVGMLKELPVSEMEALLLAQIQVTPEAMKELALARSVVVRDYLASRQLPTERLFLGAAKASPSDAKWSPRAELNLAIP